MKYDHAVKYNGTWYAPFEDINDGAVDSTPSDNFMNKPIYTKTEINRMSTADLQSLAKSEGIEDAEEKTGTELKQILIDRFVS